MNRHLRKVLLPVGLGAVLLLIWEYIAASGSVSRLLLARPSEAFLRIFQDMGLIFSEVAISLQAVLLGLLYGSVPAVLVALVLSSSPVLEKTVYPIVVFIETMPKIAFAPLLLVWFGFSSVPKLIIVSIVVFFPVLVGALAGFKSIDKRVFYNSKTMGASALQSLFYVKLPTIIPNVFSSLKISMILAITTIVVMEYIMGNTGSGFLIVRAVEREDTVLMYAVMIVVSLLGVFLTNIIEFTERIVTPWRHVS